MTVHARISISKRVYAPAQLCKIPFYSCDFTRNLRKFIGVTGDDILVKGEARLTFYAFMNYEIAEVDTSAEAVTSRGIIEPVFHTRASIYIIESEHDRTVLEILDQLEKLGDWKKYLGLGKTNYLIGINFNTNERGLDNWVAQIFSDKGGLQEEQVPTSNFWLGN